MKKLLLISPLSTRSLMGGGFWFRIPVVGLLKVAALTPPGWEVSIVDEKVERLDLEQEADLVGITSMTTTVQRGYEVAVETHGQRPTAALPPGVIRILDVKTPGSGEVATDFGFVDGLRPHDELKFVVCSEADFRWSVEVIRRHWLERRAHLLFSPVWGRVEPRDLAGWLLESGIEARLSLQLHKVIWGPAARGV